MSVVGHLGALLWTQVKSSRYMKCCRQGIEGKKALEGLTLGLPAAAQRADELSPFPVIGHVSHMVPPNRRWPGSAVLPRGRTGMNQQNLGWSMSNLAQCPAEAEPFQEPTSGLPPSVFTPRGQGPC